MKTLELCQWRNPSAFIVNCEHISSFVLIVEFEQASVCWVHISRGVKSFLFTKLFILRIKFQIRT